MEWMYKKSSDSVDREEYLLGKAIDKNFESQLSGSFNEVDKDITPTSIFTNSGSNLQVDVIRKLKEDPLEQIRQKELETRKQLLKNPVKLKKLQNMLKATQDKQEMVLKRKAKKKNNKSKEKLDELLTSKFLQMKEKFGGKKLVEIGKTKRRSGEERGYKDKLMKCNKRKKRRSKSKSSSSESSSSTEEDMSSMNHKKYETVRGEIKGNSPRREIDRDDNRYSKKFGLEVRNNNKRGSLRNNETATCSKSYTPNKQTEKTKVSLPARPKKCLTEKEKAERLKEMTENVTWRSQLTTKNIKRYKEEQKKEKETSEKDYDDGFFRRQMVLATSLSTVQQRIKSNVNNIQRSERDMNKNFARR